MEVEVSRMSDVAAAVWTILSWVQAEGRLEYRVIRNR